MALSSGLKMGLDAILHFPERKKMKARDEEIEQEREREREIESQSVLCAHDILNHFSHQHPLHKSYSLKPFECGRCNVTSAHGWALACKALDCGYCLHEVCSKGPVALRPSIDLAPGTGAAPAWTAGQLITTFAHTKEHPVKEVYSNAEFLCEHCCTSGKGRHYRCEECDVGLHPVCVKNPTRLATFMHPQHELEFRTKKHFKECHICGYSLNAGQKALNLRVYGCNECKFWVHPVCRQLPQYLVHELHHMTEPLHPLQLKLATSKTKCDKPGCELECSTGRWHYVCGICKISIHIECLLAGNAADQKESGSGWLSTVSWALVDVALLAI